MYPSDDGAYLPPPLPLDPKLVPDESMFRAWITRFNVSGSPERGAAVSGCVSRSLTRYAASMAWPSWWVDGSSPSARRHASLVKGSGSPGGAIVRVERPPFERLREVYAAGSGLQHHVIEVFVVVINSVFEARR